MTSFQCEDGGYSTVTTRFATSISVAVSGASPAREHLMAVPAGQLAGLFDGAVSSLSDPAKCAARKLILSGPDRSRTAVMDVRWDRSDTETDRSFDRNVRTTRARMLNPALRAD